MSGNNHRRTSKRTSAIRSLEKERAGQRIARQPGQTSVGRRRRARRLIDGRRLPPVGRNEPCFLVAHQCHSVCRRKRLKCRAAADGTRGCPLQSAWSAISQEIARDAR